MAQGAAAIVVAVVLVIREAAGHKEAAISGYGTAAWFGIIFTAGRWPGVPRYGSGTPLGPGDLVGGADLVAAGVPLL